MVSFTLSSKTVIEAKANYIIKTDDMFETQ